MAGDTQRSRQIRAADELESLRGDMAVLESLGLALAIAGEEGISDARDLGQGIVNACERFRSVHALLRDAERPEAAVV